MPLWAPYTFTTGEVLTAALMNQQVRDNLTWLHDRPAHLTGSNATLPLTLADTNTWYTASSLDLPEGQWLLWFAGRVNGLDPGDRFRWRIRDTQNSSTLFNLETGTWTRSGTPTYRALCCGFARTSLYTDASTDVNCEVEALETQNATVEEFYYIALRVDFAG